MVEKTPHINNSSDELDLAVLIGKAILFLKRFGLILLIGALTGLVCAGVIFKTLPKSYLSRLVLHSSILNNSEQIEIIDNWNDLLKHGEHNVLAAEFNCTPDVTARLGSLKAEEIEKLASQNSVGFVVDMTVRDRDTSILDNLRKGVVYGLENNTYVKIRVEQKRASLIELIGEVKAEIGKLDSTKKSIQSNINDGKRSGAGLMVDISGINKVRIELEEKRLLYEEQLKFVDAIFVLQFIEYATPVSPKLSVIMATGLAAGLFIGFIICLLKIVKTRVAAAGSPAVDA